MECYTTTLLTHSWYRKILNTTLEFGPYQLNITNAQRTKSAIIHFHATIQGGPRWDDYWWLLSIFFTEPLQLQLWNDSQNVQQHFLLEKFTVCPPQDTQHISSWYWNPTPTVLQHRCIKFSSHALNSSS